MKNISTEKDKAIQILKTKGPQPLSVLSSELNVTTEGARFNLLKLANEGLVEAKTESKGRGRPQQIWSLTPAGHALFPDTHADLTVHLINTIRTTLGDAALEAVMDAHEKRGTERYGQELRRHDTLESKVTALVELRTKEGYMAEYYKDNDGYVFIENHCPICAAATACPRLCQSELNTFQALLGENASIQRIDHITAGARRCAYRITAIA